MKKICTECKAEKYLGAFAVGKAYRLGVRAMCKECTNRKERISYANQGPEKRAKRMVRHSANQKNDRLNNPQKYRDAYSKEDRVQRSAQGRAWYARNKDQQRARVLRWHRKNPLRARQTILDHTTTQIFATPKWLSAIHNAQIDEMYEIAKARTMQIGIKHHVDHIFPLRGRGFVGLHVPWNLQILTADQNLAKKNKVPPQYADLFWKAA